MIRADHFSKHRQVDFASSAASHNGQLDTVSLTSSSTNAHTCSCRSYSMLSNSCLALRLEDINPVDPLPLCHLVNSNQKTCCVAYLWHIVFTKRHWELPWRGDVVHFVPLVVASSQPPTFRSWSVQLGPSLSQHELPRHGRQKVILFLACLAKKVWKIPTESSAENCPQDDLTELVGLLLQFASKLLLLKNCTAKAVFTRGK